MFVCKRTDRFVFVVQRRRHTRESTHRQTLIRLLSLRPSILAFTVRSSECFLLHQCLFTAFLAVIGKTSPSFCYDFPSSSCPHSSTLDTSFLLDLVVTACFYISDITRSIDHINTRAEAYLELTFLDGAFCPPPCPPHKVRCSDSSLFLWVRNYCTDLHGWYATFGVIFDFCIPITTSHFFRNLPRRTGTSK